MKVKIFKYTWDAEIFLLHLQLNKRDEQAFDTHIIRQFRDGKTEEEIIPVKPEGTSHRFLVTRTHPRETSFVFTYPTDIELEAFKLDDRAYYPTESFFKG